MDYFLIFCLGLVAGILCCYYETQQMIQRCQRDAIKQYNKERDNETDAR